MCSADRGDGSGFIQPAAPITTTLEHIQVNESLGAPRFQDLEHLQADGPELCFGDDQLRRRRS